MKALTVNEVEQVAGGARMLQAIGDYMAIGAGVAVLAGPGGLPIAMALGIGSAAFEITDSFLD